MKKLTSLMVAVLVLVLMLAPAGFAQETATEYKSGLAVITSVSAADAAADAEGQAQVNSVIAAVLIDSEGKIVDIAIDGAQNTAPISVEGKLNIANPAPQTKNELGADYGMGKASSIGKEWFEQIDALEQYVIGKTADEISGIAGSEAGAPTDADLSASVTIKIGDYKELIVKAIQNAQASAPVAAQGKVGIGVINDLSGSTDATAEEEGSVSSYSTFAAVIVDENGNIAALALDATQVKIAFDASGKITTNLDDFATPSKNELGADYGMAKASSIGKEWFEQAAAFAEYAIGKTAEEISGVAVSEEGVPTDADLSASVTIKIGGFQNVVAKAMANAA